MIVLDLVSLTPRILARDDLVPTLARLAEEGAVTQLKPPFPAVTCPAQATLTTGTLPRDHGVVANGWFDRERHEVGFWEQPDALVQAPRTWDRLKARNPGTRAAMLFHQQSMYSTADLVLSPRPLHLDSGLVQWVYSKPVGLYEDLVPDVGAFNLFDYWGPLSNEKSSRWIGKAAARVLGEHKPTLAHVYFPHVDYANLKYGPSSEQVETAYRTLDGIVADFLDDARGTGAVDGDTAVALVGEYAFHDVTLPITPNVALREAGLLTVREIAGHEYLDTEMSRAFAVADHQVAHVYCHPDAVDDARAVLRDVKGIDYVLDAEGKRALGIDHARAGDLVAVAQPNAWFTYYYWRDAQKAPPFAHTMDIHRKPGFDPVELFMDPQTRRIPLEPGLVKGSHGRAPTGPRDYTSLVLWTPDGDVTLPTGEHDVLGMERVAGLFQDTLTGDAGGARSA